MGGLAPAVSSEGLRSFLSQFGEVLDATVMFDRETGRSKGFAFATFADEQTVGIAMNASGIELEGKQVGHILVVACVSESDGRLKSRKLNPEDPET